MARLILVIDKHTEVNRNESEHSKDLNPIVSVVMPVYNVEGYVLDAIQSILNQTLYNLELIIIDDGSKDSSSVICRKAAMRDKRVKYVSQANAGLGASRNRGIDLASGIYVYFIDSDDMLEAEALEKMTNIMDANRLDVLYFESKLLVEDGAVHDSRQYRRRREYVHVESGSNFFHEAYANRDFIMSACMLVCRLDILRHNSIRFLEKAKHEDNLFAFLLLCYANRVRCISKPYYIRRYRPDSIMTTIDYKGSFLDYFKTYCEIDKYIRERENVRDAGIGDAFKALLRANMRSACFGLRQNRRNVKNCVVLTSSNEIRLLDEILASKQFSNLEYGLHYLLFLFRKYRNRVLSKCSFFKTSVGDRFKTLT